jgi:hypothetical protein
MRPLLAHRIIESSDRFTPKYDTRCGKTIISDSAAFVGVLDVDGATIPISDIFTHTEGMDNKIIIADFSRFVIWSQYSPVDDPEDETDVEGPLLIHVTDLNKAEGRRQSLIAENPLWLRDIDDKEDYLRGRVIINAYEKFKVEVCDSAAAVVLSVTDAREDEVLPAND